MSTYSPLRAALLTMPGALLAGAAGACAATSLVLAGIWLATGRNGNPESAIAGKGAVGSLALALVLAVALRWWGRTVVNILESGERCIGEIVRVRRGREAVVDVLFRGMTHQVVVVGQCHVERGDAVTVRVPIGRRRPVLIEEVFRDAMRR